MSMHTMKLSSTMHMRVARSAARTRTCMFVTKRGSLDSNNMPEYDDTKQVFQAWPAKHSSSIYEIQDCIYASNGMNLKEKREYFFSNNLNYENVLIYYEYVKSLERAYAMRAEPLTLSDIVAYARDVCKFVHVYIATCVHIVCK